MAELKMTVVCKSCDNQYGAWRTHCPACGTMSDYRAPEPERAKEPRQKRSEAQRPKREHECILCRRGNSQERCPSCNEEVHTRCLKYHLDPCKLFVAEREAILREAILKAVPVEAEAVIKKTEAAGNHELAERMRAALRRAGMTVRS